jgi:glycosyltransferase involved in cell wall biosynthesis
VLTAAGKTSICIGWTGSITTLRHLESAVPVLQRLHERFPGRLVFRVIADKPWSHEGLPVEFIRWTRERETEDLAGIDIGIMPLPDNNWARGKCGFKGLQYMAMGIPAVMSPVGVNTEIITNGVNGLLAATHDEWVDQLSLLINDASLRRRLGDAGRATVVERYSYEAWKERYVGLMEGLIHK